jgi:hypothetical protein
MFMYFMHASPNKKANYLITGLDRLLGLDEVEANRIARQLLHVGGKVVRLEPRTGRLYPQDISPAPIADRG